MESNVGCSFARVGYINLQGVFERNDENVAGKLCTTVCETVCKRRRFSLVDRVLCCGGLASPMSAYECDRVQGHKMCVRLLRDNDLDMAGHVIWQRP